jgi:hypothetical protein
MMSIAKIFSRAMTGMEAQLVTVEVHISNGLPSLSIVGNINPNFYNLILFVISNWLHIIKKVIRLTLIIWSGIIDF